MIRETITLTQEEHHRAHLLSRVHVGALRAAEAARLLGVSLRQLRRLLARLRHGGPGALAHGNRGRSSPRQLPERLRQQVLRLARTTYAGFNDHHLAEMLRERDGLRISRRSLQRLLRHAGLGSPRTRRPPRHRRRRDRMPQAGLLVQLDGSHHAWLETRGPRLVLLAAIDDASGRVLAALFRLAEDTPGYLLLLRQLLRRHGIPGAVYSDRHSIFAFSRTTPMTLPEQLRGHHDPTQVGRALQELGIRWIAAHSPQAKGRIERLFGSLQDRLVAELRLAHAQTRADAQRVLARFLPRYNARFARRPVDPAPAWRPAPPAQILETICCLKEQRTVANDNTIQVGDRLLHLLPGPGGRSYARARVDVHLRLDGTVAVYYHGQRLTVHVDPVTPTRIPSYMARNGKTRPPAALRGPAPPAANHPWRQYPQTARRKELRALGVTFSQTR